jgi:hypothetical protein
MARLRPACWRQLYHVHGKNRLCYFLRLLGLLGLGQLQGAERSGHAEAVPCTDVDCACDSAVMDCSLISKTERRGFRVLPENQQKSPFTKPLDAQALLVVAGPQLLLAHYLRRQQVAAARGSSTV